MSVCFLSTPYDSDVKLGLEITMTGKLSMLLLEVKSLTMYSSHPSPTYSMALLLKLSPLPSESPISPFLLELSYQYTKMSQ